MEDSSAVRARRSTQPAAPTITQDDGPEEPSSRALTWLRSKKQEILVRDFLPVKNQIHGVETKQLDHLLLGSVAIVVAQFLAFVVAFIVLNPENWFGDFPLVFPAPTTAFVSPTFLVGEGCEPLRKLTFSEIKVVPWTANKITDILFDQFFGVSATEVQVTSDIRSCIDKINESLEYTLKNAGGSSDCDLGSGKFCVILLGSGNILNFVIKRSFRDQDGFLSNSVFSDLGIPTSSDGRFYGNEPVPEFAGRCTCLYGIPGDPTGQVCGPTDFNNFLSMSNSSQQRLFDANAITLGQSGVPVSLLANASWEGYDLQIWYPFGFPVVTLGMKEKLLVRWYNATGRDFDQDFLHSAENPFRPLYPPSLQTFTLYDAYVRGYPALAFVALKAYTYVEDPDESLRGMLVVGCASFPSDPGNDVLAKRAMLRPSVQDMVRMLFNKTAAEFICRNIGKPKESSFVGEDNSIPGYLAYGAPFLCFRIQPTSWLSAFAQAFSAAGIIRISLILLLPSLGRLIDAIKKRRGLVEKSNEAVAPKDRYPA